MLSCPEMLNPRMGLGIYFMVEDVQVQLARHLYFYHMHPIQDFVYMSHYIVINYILSLIHI